MTNEIIRVSEALEEAQRRADETGVTQYVMVETNDGGLAEYTIHTEHIKCSITPLMMYEKVEPTTIPHESLEREIESAMAWEAEHAEVEKKILKCLIAMITMVGDPMSIGHGILHTLTWSQKKELLQDMREALL